MKEKFPTTHLFANKHWLESLKSTTQNVAPHQLSNKRAAQLYSLTFCCNSIKKNTKPAEYETFLQKVTIVEIIRNALILWFRDFSLCIAISLI